MQRAAKKVYEKRLPSMEQAKAFLNYPRFFSWVIGKARQAVHRIPLPELLSGYPDHFLGVILARHVHQTLTSPGFGDRIREALQKHHQTEFGVGIVSKHRIQDVEAVMQINEMLAKRIELGRKLFFPDPHWTAFVTAMEVEPLYMSTAMMWLAGQWNIVPPATKFVLIGGADAVRAVAGGQKLVVNIQDFARIYAYVGTKAAEKLNPFPDSPEITRWQVNYALKECNKLMPLKSWVALNKGFVIPTSFLGFQRHWSERGRCKSE